MKFDLLKHKDESVVENMPLCSESSSDLIGQHLHFKNNYHRRLFFWSSGCECKHYFFYTRFVLLQCLISKILTISTYCQQGTVETFKLGRFVNSPLLICLAFERAIMFVLYIFAEDFYFTLKRMSLSGAWCH